MNYHFESESDHYGNTNDAQIQPVPPSQMSNQNNKKPAKSFKQKINAFLMSNTNTILATAIGMSIGFSFKDLISSIISNIIQPTIIKLLYLIDKNNYYNLDDLITTDNKTINFPKFSSDFFTFILVVISVYYVSKYVTDIV